MAEDPNGRFSDDVVSQYLKKKGDKYTHETVEFFGPLFNEELELAIEAQAFANDVGTNALRDAGECLYMDVGLWAGNGPKSDQNHERHRDFGIVCGSVAVLCSFSGGKDGKPDFGQEQEQALKDSGGSGMSTYKEHIKPLLVHLSQAGKAHDLGDVQVVGALAVTNRVLARGAPIDEHTIHVFIGDLHLPIVDRSKTQDDGKTPDGAKTSDYVPREGRLDISDKVKAEMRRAVKAAMAAAMMSGVVTKGSDPLKPLELEDDARAKVKPMVDQAMADGAQAAAAAETRGIPSWVFDETLTVLSWVPVPWEWKLGAYTAAHVSKIGPFAAVAADELWRVLADEQIWKWHKQETDCAMSRTEAQEWADYYLGKGDRKGADIFQGAAADLVEFLRRLEEWADKNAAHHVHIVQTGDLMDFWVGLKCGFGLSSIAPPVAQVFVGHWHRKLMQTERAGKVLRAFNRLVGPRTAGGRRRTIAVAGALPST